MKNTQADYRAAGVACNLPHIQKQLDMITSKTDWRRCLEDAYRCGFLDGLVAERSREPDAKCVTTPDGGCTGTGCMHDVQS